MKTIKQIVARPRVKSFTATKDIVIVKDINGISHKYTWEYFEKNILKQLVSPSK